MPKYSAKFDPNAPEVEPINRWASYSDTRTRDRGFKTHTTFAMMRSAIGHCQAIRCFERVNGFWVEIYAHAWKKGGETYLGSEDECFICKESLSRGSYNGGWWYWSGKEPFSKVRLCFASKCKRTNGVYKVSAEPLTPHSTASNL